jgi:hypothetical protein
MRRVIVHIDRLVLAELHRADQHAIAMSLQEELRRRFADPAMLVHLLSGGDVSRLAGGRIRIERGAGPPAVGAQIASRVTRAIGAPTPHDRSRHPSKEDHR